MVHSLTHLALGCVWLFASPWTLAPWAFLSMGFFRQEHWSGLPFSSPGDLPHPGIEPGSPWLMLSKCLLSKWAYVKLLINVASPLFSCITGPEEEEEAWEAAHSDWWHTFHHWVPERSLGKLIYQHRSVKEYGPCSESHESRSWGHVSDRDLPLSLTFPQSFGTLMAWAGMGLLIWDSLTCWNGMLPQRKSRSFNILAKEEKIMRK